MLGFLEDFPAFFFVGLCPDLDFPQRAFTFGFLIVLPFHLVGSVGSPGDIMSFDPSVLTVKKAIAKLDGMSDEELSSAYDAELDGRGRKSLLGAIVAMRIPILAPVIPQVVNPRVEEAVVPREIGTESFMRMHYVDRRKWKSVGGGRFVEVG